MLLFGAKGGARAAMSAATGMMKGFHEGNLQKAEEGRKDFNTKMEEVHARNDNIQKEYQDALNKYKDDTNGLQAQLSMIATKYNIPILAKQTEMGQIDQALKVMDGHWRAAEKLRIDQQRVNNQVEALQLKKSVAGLSTSQIKANQEVLVARDQFMQMSPEEKAKVLADGRSPISINTPSAKTFRLMTKSMFGGDPSYADINSYAAKADQNNITNFPWSQQYSQEAGKMFSDRLKGLQTGATQQGAPPTQGQPGAQSGPFKEGQTATGADGKKIIFRGGKWAPASSGGTMMDATSLPTMG
jgi:hypothetical protein